MNNKFLLLALFFTTLLLSCAPKQKDFEFYIVQLNDVYEIAPINNGKNGGFARVAWLIDSLKVIGNPVYTVLAGDFLSPSFIGTIKSEELGERIYGMHVIETMNAAGVDLVTFGNHEFDIPEHSLHKRMNASSFNWTSANTKSADKRSPFGKQTRNGFEPVPDYVIQSLTSQTGQHLKLGILSVTLPFNKASYVKYEDPFESVKRVFPTVNNESDIIVFLTHLEAADDKKLAELYPSVPLIMGGHDHSNMEINTEFNKVTKADANAKSIYIHKLSYNYETKKVSVSSELKMVTDQIPSQEKTDQVVQKWLSIAHKNMERLGFENSKVITKSDSLLDGLESNVRFKQTNLGKIIANSMKFASKNADVAVLNSGSIRIDDKLIGVITLTDIFRILPYGGKVVQTTMKGSDLEKMLHIGLETNIGIGGYLQTAGVSLENNYYLINGKKLSKAKSYNVVLTDFMSSGKEANFDWIKDFTLIDVIVDPNDPKENDIRQLLINYIKSLDEKKK